MKKYAFLLIAFIAVSLCAHGQTRPDWSQIKNRPAVTTATISTLRALSVPTETFNVWVENYSIAGDHGGGLFVWNASETAADNYGTVIKPTAVAVASAGRWLRECEPNIINVRHFGAIGDGVVTEVAYNPTTHTGGHVASYTGKIHTFSGTDDTAAFQRAYAAMGSGKTLYIPSGNYIINGNNAAWSTGVAGERPGMVFDGLSNVTICGDGEASRLCVTYDVSQDTSTLEHTFILFLFRGCTDVVVKDMHIDFQCLGWSTVQVSGDDSDTRITGAVMFWNDDTNPALRNKADRLLLRVNHPFGSYWGDAYAPGKYSTKLVATYINGLYGSPPASVTTEPTSDSIMAESCEVTNCTFYNGQPYSVFLWMTDNSKIVGNRFFESGGQLPIIRGPHLNRGTLIQDNYFEVVPRYENGSGVSYCIFFFNNTGNYICRDIKILDNQILLRDGVSGISPIRFDGGENVTIKNNTIRSEDTGTSASVYYSGITFTESPSEWTAFGGRGEARDCDISGNKIYGSFYNGIYASCFSPRITNNTIDCSNNTYGISVTARQLGVISENSVSHASSAGIFVVTPATSTTDLRVDVTGNHINDCGIGLGCSNAAAYSLTNYTRNYIANCAIGTTNLAAGRSRLHDSYYASCTVDLDTAALSVASLTADLTVSPLFGRWKIYGTPGVATSGF